MEKILSKTQYESSKRLNLTQSPLTLQTFTEGPLSVQC